MRSMPGPALPASDLHRSLKIRIPIRISTVRWPKNWLLKTVCQRCSAAVHLPAGRQYCQCWSVTEPCCSIRRSTRGFEYCPNVIYGGATPNQTVIPLAEYLFEYHGKRLFLVGSDYIYPREINRIMSEFLQESAGEVVGEMYVPLGSPDDQFRNAVSRIAATAPDAVLSTVVGSDTAKLYAAFHAQGLDVASMPVASLTTSESELAEIPEDARAGHLTAACYFAALDNAASNRFRERYAHRFGQDELPSIYAETAYSQAHLFAQTVAATGTDDADMLLHALLGARFDAPQGMIMIDPDNNHVYATPKIGRARRDGGFDVLWQSGSWTKPDPYLIAYDRTISRSAFG